MDGRKSLRGVILRAPLCGANKPVYCLWKSFILTYYFRSFFVIFRRSGCRHVIFNLRNLPVSLLQLNQRNWRFLVMFSSSMWVFGIFIFLSLFSIWNFIFSSSLSIFRIFIFLSWFSVFWIWYFHHHISVFGVWYFHHHFQYSELVFFIIIVSIGNFHIFIIIVSNWNFQHLQFLQCLSRLSVFGKRHFHRHCQYLELNVFIIIVSIWSLIFFALPQGQQKPF